MNDYVLRSDIVKTLLCILAVLLLFLVVNRVHMWLLWRRWVRERVAKLREIEAKEPKKEQDDPCDTCLRWPECNGADRDTCPNCETVLHLVPCPKCGGNPIPVRVGDNKQLFAMRCKNCGYFAARPHEAGLTDEQATVIWNRRAGDELLERMVDDGK